MKELGQIIEGFLRRNSMWRQYKQFLLVDQWSQIVGKEIAAVTAARQLDNKVLRVTVKDSTWAYHLTLLKPQLLSKLNEYAGNKLVRDIYYQVGELGKGK